MVKKPLPSLDNDRIIKTDNLTPPVNSGNDELKNDENINNDNKNAEIQTVKLTIRLKSTHSTNYRYRGGFKFTYDEQVLDVSELLDEQIQAIKNDDALIVSEL